MTAEEKIDKIKEILIAVEGVADGQAFGLSYCQAIDYLDAIASVLEM